MPAISERATCLFAQHRVIRERGRQPRAAMRLDATIRNADPVLLLAFRFCRIRELPAKIAQCKCARLACKLRSERDSGLEVTAFQPTPPVE